MKKHIARTISLVLVLLLGLCACGEVGEPTESAVAKETPSTRSTEPPQSSLPPTESPDPAPRSSPDSSGEVLELEGLSFKIEGDHAVVWGSKRNVKDVVIPESIAGVPVTEVADKGFKDMVKLRSLYLPEGLLKIGESAFENCYALLSVTLPESLVELGKNAFYKCEALESVVLGHNLRVLPSGCFSYCAALTSVVIPEGVEQIISAFQIGRDSPGDLDVTLPRSLKRMVNGFCLTSNYGCLKIRIPDFDCWFSIDSSTEQTSHYSYKEDPADPDSPWLTGTQTERLPGKLINDTNAQLYVGDALVTEAFFPAGLTRVPEYCFAGVASITSAVIPEGVTAIGKYAFENAGLTSVSFPASLEEIGQYAFTGCPLESLTIPGSVRSVGTLGDMKLLGVLALEEGVCFFDGVDNCPSLGLLILPASMILRTPRAYSQDMARCSTLLLEGGTREPPYVCDLVKSCRAYLKIELDPENPSYTLDSEGRICYKVDPFTLSKTAGDLLYPDPDGYED